MSPSMGSPLRILTTITMLTFQMGTIAAAGGLCVAGSSLYPIGIELNNVEFTGNEGTMGGAIYSSPWCDI